MNGSDLDQELLHTPETHTSVERWVGQSFQVICSFNDLERSLGFKEGRTKRKAEAGDAFRWCETVRLH